MIEVALAQPEDFATTPPYRCRAYAVKKDGRVIGIGGLGFMPNGYVFLWAEITDELRALPITLHKVGKRAIGDAIPLGIKQVYATTDIAFEAADRWIKRLGFSETGEVVDGKKVHLWHAH